MKIILERDDNGEIISIETITEKKGILSDSERTQLQMFYDKGLKKLKRKHTNEKYQKTSSNSIGNVVLDDCCLQPKDSQSNDKKIFMCRICGVSRDSVYDYFVLAEDTEDAKRVVTNHSPLMSDDIYCIDIESLKTHMIKENNEIKLYG